MNSLWIHIPFLVTLGAGDQLAGEATGGTFRLLLTRPASRTPILFAKYLTTLLYTAALVVFLAVLSLGLGVLLFGTGDLLVPGRTIVIHPEGEALARLLLAFGLAIWGMWTVASLAFLFSSLVENAHRTACRHDGGDHHPVYHFQCPGGALRVRQTVSVHHLPRSLAKVLEDPIPWPGVLHSAVCAGRFQHWFLRRDLVYFCQERHPELGPPRPPTSENLTMDLHGIQQALRDAENRRLALLRFP